MIPSVSRNVAALDTARDWIVERLTPLADTVTTVTLTGLGDVILGRIQGQSDRAITLYVHYDVQPEGDHDRWTHPPFGAEIHDGRMYARGACDDKADVAARLAALELWLEDHQGTPPYTVIFIADPCEEIGSPGLRGVLEEHADALRSEGVLWESYLREEDGRPSIGLGCRGVLEVELNLKLLTANQHPSYSQLLRSAPLEMMRTISSLTDAGGKITIPGFTDGALQPTASAAERAATIALPEEAIAMPGVNPFLSSNERQRAVDFVYAPSMSVSRFDVDDAIRQSIAASCVARVRFGLVPGMHPESAFSALSSHIQNLNPDIQVSLVRSMQPAYSPIGSGLADAVTVAARKAFQSGEPQIYDVMTGAGPGSAFTDVLGSPIVSPSGTLRPDGNMHGYDEHGHTADFLTHIQFTLQILQEFEVTMGARS